MKLFLFPLSSSLLSLRTEELACVDDINAKSVKLVETTILINNGTSCHSFIANAASIRKSDDIAQCQDCIS